MKKNKGFSLIEILVVISIFSIVGILSTRAVLLTMRGAKKSESQVKVRENVNYALSIIERQIRNSEDVSPCPNTSELKLDYVSSDGIPTFFSCTVGASGKISSGSATLTSSDVSITDCSFTCTQTSSNNPPIVNVSIIAEDKTATGIEKGSVTAETEIVTRNY